MTTPPNALERARSSPRVKRIAKGMERAMFLFVVISISATWTIGVPLVFLTTDLDLASVIAWFLVPGLVWGIVWYNRRDEAKEAVKSPVTC